MKSVLFVFLLKCVLVGHSVLHAQTLSRYNTFSYGVNEGLLQSTITDIAIDKNNFCWLSFPNGIQKFDGKNFVTVPVQPGLPDDKLCNLFRCTNGDILISHSQGISIYNISKNRFIQITTSHVPREIPAQFIGEDDQTVYIYSPTGIITAIDTRSYKITSEVKTSFPDYSNDGNFRPNFSSNIINHKTVIGVNLSLYLWDLRNGKMVSQSTPIPHLSIYFLNLKSEHEVFYYTYKVAGAIQLYNFSTKTNRIVPLADNIKSISRCIVYPWQNKNLVAVNNSIYECAKSSWVFQSELVNFQNQPVAGMLTIARVKEDNFGNLYLVTVTGGIKKIIRDNYPIKYYTAGKKEDNITLCILPDKKNNRILSGTAGNGLLVFDTLQNLIKHVATLPGKSIEMSPNLVLKSSNGYHVFIAGSKSVWQLRNDLSQLKSIPIITTLPEEQSGIQYFANFLSQNKEQAIVQSQEMLYKIDFATNKVSEHLITSGYIMGGLLYNNTIITHGNDQLIYLDATTLKVIKNVPFKNTGYVRCFTRDGANNIYVGSNKGIFKINSDGKILQHHNKANGLPDECIYAMVFDDEGLLWCSTNKGIFRLNKDNSILQLKKEDGLQENEFNTNAVAKAEDGEIFFGGVNGISSFYPSAIKSFEDKPSLLITGIKIDNEDYFKDTAAWMLNRIVLPYNKNSFSFDFVAMGANNPEQYIYQYRMQGIDKSWIKNDGIQTVRYFLPPGKYVFQVYASRFFNKDAMPMKEIMITIEQPFWKTWWFIGTWVVLLGALLVLGISRHNKINYERKLSVIESDFKLQKERERISRDLHDNIGAYANAVLYNTELLQKEDNIHERNELMSDLKFASKDIIVALRETVWALKKDHYTGQECMLRIRNFVHPLTRYYHHIQFKVDGEAPPNITFDSTTALNLVRIVQEAVSNAIKHSAATNISIKSSLENKRWCLSVKDDGVGFDYNKQLQSGNGLTNMNQRSTDSDFGFLIHSAPGEGTEITIIVGSQHYPKG